MCNMLHKRIVEICNQQDQNNKKKCVCKDQINYINQAYNIIGDQQVYKWLSRHKLSAKYLLNIYTLQTK